MPDKEINTYSEEGLEELTLGTASRIRRIAAGVGLWLIRNSSSEHLAKEKRPLTPKQHHSIQGKFVAIATQHQESKLVTNDRIGSRYRLFNQAFDDDKTIEILCNIDDSSAANGHKGSGLLRIRDPELGEHHLYVSSSEPKINAIEIGKGNPGLNPDPIDRATARSVDTWLAIVIEQMGIPF